MADAEVSGTLSSTGNLAETSLYVTPRGSIATPPRRRADNRDPYAPLGMGTGAVTFYPSITVGAVYTGNVNSSASDPESDIGLQLRPSLRHESDWVRHSWTGGANGNLILYKDNTDLDARSLDVFQRVRLDVRRGTEAVLSVRYALDQSGVGDSDVPATATGYRTEHTLSGSAGLSHDVGPITAEMKAGLTGRIYGDVELNGGGTENNDDRDYAEPSLSLRATYAEPPALKPYVEASYTPRYHNIKRDRNGLRRDSHGFAAAAGVEIDAGPIWTGEIGLTYLHRNYEDAALDATNAIGLTGGLTWSPTELTRVVMSAGTSIAETTSATVSGNPLWTASIDISQALRENVDVTAGIAIEIEDTGQAIDTTYDTNLGVSWKLNPVLSWTAGYDLTWLDAGTPGRSYSEHRVSTGVTLSR
jgi:hypothetical protein